MVSYLDTAILGNGVVGWEVLGEGTKGVVFVSCGVVGSCKGKIYESTPEVKAFFAMGVFNSTLNH